MSPAACLATADLGQPRNRNGNPDDSRMRGSQSRIRQEHTQKDHKWRLNLEFAEASKAPATSCLTMSRVFPRICPS